MNTKLKLACLCVLFHIPGLPAFGQGTAFTYQGRLFDNTNPANGSYAIRFTVYDGSNTLNTVAGPLALAPVAVSNGLFTVVLDFGAGPFAGAARWLQVDSATNSVSPLYIPMSPRQQLTPAPYAIFATTASNLSGTLSATQLTGTVPSTALSGPYSGAVTLSNSANTFSGAYAGNGAGVSNVNAGTLTGILPGTALSGPYSGAVMLSNTANSFTGSFTGNGGALSNLNAANLTNTVPSAALSGTYSGALTLNNAANSFTGNGSGLTSLNAGALGNTLPSAVLNGTYSSAVTLNNAADSFTGNGAGLTSVNAATLGGLASSAFAPASGSAIYVAKAGDTMTGTLNFSGSNSIAAFGSQTRQMLDLFNNAGIDYGIGVQTSTLYQRSAGDFAWYEGGVHNDGQDNPGGGTTLMTLDSSGHLSVFSSTPGGAVYGTNLSGVGVGGGSSTGLGVWGECTSGYGVQGSSTSGVGVFAISTSGVGVNGSSTSSTGANGLSQSGVGVYGSTQTGSAGVIGENFTPTDAYVSVGVLGIAHDHENGLGVHGINTAGGLAGWFDQDVFIQGDLTVAGNKSFKIDHPLDPANKYLLHACIESPEVKNLYDGTVTTDAAGDANIVLPNYFEAINRDFRYQLTVLGQFAQAIVSSEISSNQFSIKTDKPNVKVSWQVTGIRNDAYEKAHPMVVEQDKPARERGTYQHPELFGQPEEKGLSWAMNPELMKRLKAERTAAAASLTP